MPQWKGFDDVKKLVDDLTKGLTDVSEIEKVIEETVQKHYAGRKALNKASEKLLKQKKDELKVTQDIEKSYGRIATSFKRFFSGEKLKELTSDIKGEITGTFQAAKDGVSNILNSPTFRELGSKVFTGLKFAGIGALTGIVLAGKAVVDQFMKIDNAVSDVMKTSGVLDNSLNTVLINAVDSSSILGGNVEEAAKAANELYKQFSVAIPLSGKLVGNVATIADRFGLGVETATKLTRIIGQETNASISQASDITEKFINSLGRIGPAVVQNIADSYDTVINSFGLGLKQLKEQGIQATRLGISLSDAAEVSKGLLDLGSSITAQFKASALLGGQLNLQRARQLAFQNDIVGANNAILDQVQKLGDLSKLNTYQRQALAQATGKTVSELQKELYLRSHIGRRNRIDEATRRSVLTRFEAISRRISGAFFRIVSSPKIQNLIGNVVDNIVKFLDGPRFSKFISGLSDFVDSVAGLLSGEYNLNPISFLFGGNLIQQHQSKNITRFNDGIITNKGEAVSTNPRDYIIATQNPAGLVNGDNNNNEIMGEVRDLLKYLKEHGVKAGDTYMDGKKVSKQLAIAGR